MSSSVRKTDHSTASPAVFYRAQGESVWRGTRLFQPMVLVVCVFCVIASVLLNRVWEMGYVSSDAAYFDFVYRMTADGAVPYRDYFVIHGPVAYWLSGLFQFIFGSTIGLAVFAGLTFFILMAACASLAIEAVGKRTTPAMRWGIAVVAASVAGSWGPLASFIPVGGRPKFLAIALSLVALLVLSRRWSFWGGVLLAFACWTWQPAIFQASAVFFAYIIVLRMTSDPKGPLSVFKMVSGGFAASALCAVILLIQGTLDDFWDQSVLFPILYQVSPQPHAAGVHRPTGIGQLFVPFMLFKQYMPLAFVIAACTTFVGVVAGIVSVIRFGSGGNTTSEHISDGNKSQQRGRRKTDSGNVSNRKSAANIPMHVRFIRTGSLLCLAFSYLQLVVVAHGPGYLVSVLAPLGVATGWSAGWVIYRCLPLIQRIDRRWIKRHRTRGAVPQETSTGSNPLTETAEVDGVATNATPQIESLQRRTLMPRWKARRQRIRNQSDAASRVVLNILSIGFVLVTTAAAASLLVSGTREQRYDGGRAASEADWLLNQVDSGDEILIVGDSTIRSYVGGTPREHDVQWIHGRDRFIESRYPGGLSGYVDFLLSTKPRIIYVSDRARSLWPLIYDRLGSEYQPIPQMMGSERVAYIRSSHAQEDAGNIEIGDGATSP